MRQKRGNGAGRDQQPRPDAESPLSQHSSGRHRTLLAAHQREATDPRHPAAHHAADAVAYDGEGYPILPGDVQDWDGQHGDSWEAEPTARMDQPAHPPRRKTLGPRHPATSTVIYDRETGLLPINLPALGASPTVPAPSTASTALAPVPRARPPRSNTLQRMTHGMAQGVQRAAATGALVLRLRARNAGTTVIPGAEQISVHIPALPGKRTRASRLARPAIVATVCVALVSAVLLAGAANPGGLITPFTQGIWASRGGIHSVPAPIGGWWAPPIVSDAPAAPSTTDPAHYVSKYGFDWPSLNGGLAPDERQRLEYMLPFALAATARWDARYGDTLEPEMLLYWTHSEGIGARVNYSNCANERAPAGTSWFTYVTNCDTPSFWQLGYGNQFSVISILKTAFTDMRGDPNDPKAVQRVGQAVLDWDRKQGTTPTCGGYSCTFPAMTIDQIMAGVSLTHETTDDWWASVLSRDPAINCYMLARALVWFSHNATRNWVGCYYAEPCWSYESNSLGDILAAWPSLRKAAGM